KQIFSLAARWQRAIPLGSARAVPTCRSRSSLHLALLRLRSCRTQLKASEIEVFSSRLSRFLALLDQFPELAGLAERLVFRSGKFAAEKEIAKRVLVQDTMDGDSFPHLLEI